MDFAVDLETLGRNAGCVILSLGAVAFERDEEDVRHFFYVEFQVQQQLKDGFRVDADTLRWWCTQKESGVLMGEDHDREDLFAGLNDFAGFVGDHSSENSPVWSVGNDFDIAMLRYAYNFYDQEWPFAYDAARDVRTLCDVEGFNRKEFEVPELRKHHALDDAKYAARVVQEVFRRKSQ